VKVSYKGFDVDAYRSKSRGGDTLLYYSVFRQSDGYEVTSGFSYGTDKVRAFIGFLKGTVDDFLEDPQAYYRNPNMKLDANEYDDEPEEVDENAEPLEEAEDIQ
jgi:hypothetical protein